MLTQRCCICDNACFGLAFNWEEDKSTLSHHVVPREIARRIVDKIQTAEDFKAYIVVPMWPEGDPASGPIQEILHWQVWPLMQCNIGIALLYQRQF